VFFCPWVVRSNFVTEKQTLVWYVLYSLIKVVCFWPWISAFTCIYLMSLNLILYTFKFFSPPKTPKRQRERSGCITCSHEVFTCFGWSSPCSAYGTWTNVLMTSNTSTAWFVVNLTNQNYFILLKQQELRCLSNFMSFLKFHPDPKVTFFSG